MSTNAIAVRESVSADEAAITRIHREAFDTDAEARLVGRLAGDGDIVLSLLALAGGEPISSIIYSRLLIDGKDLRAVALGPVGVLPAHQRKGIGAQLIGEAHRRLSAAGERIVLVLGDPAYYRRFEFSEALAKDFRTPYDGPYMTALRLGGTAGPVAGTVTYPRAFAGLA